MCIIIIILLLNFFIYYWIARICIGFLIYTWMLRMRTMHNTATIMLNSVLLQLQNWHFWILLHTSVYTLLGLQKPLCAMTEQHYLSDQCNYHKYTKYFKIVYLCDLFISDAICSQKGLYVRFRVFVYSKGLNLVLELWICTGRETVNIQAETWSHKSPVQSRLSFTHGHYNTQTHTHTKLCNVTQEAPKPTRTHLLMSWRLINHSCSYTAYLFLYYSLLVNSITFNYIKT